MVVQPAAYTREAAYELFPIAVEAVQRSSHQGCARGNLVSTWVRKPTNSNQRGISCPAERIYRAVDSGEMSQVEVGNDQAHFPSITEADVSTHIVPSNRR